MEEIRKRREQALHGGVLERADDRSGSDPEIGFEKAGASDVVYEQNLLTERGMQDAMSMEKTQVWI